MLLCIYFKNTYIVKEAVDALRGVLFQCIIQGNVLVVKHCVKLELVLQPFTFFVTSGTSNNCTTLEKTSQIAIIYWANAGILSAALLAQRRQMTLCRCHVAHRANLIANRWFQVGPTAVAQQALHMPT